MSVAHDTSGDANEQAQRLTEPSIGFWLGVRREECPYPPGSEQAKRWLKIWDATLDQALADLMANREIVRQAEAIRNAMQAGSQCLLACERFIKSLDLRMRCRSARASFNGLIRTLESAEPPERQLHGRKPPHG